jgi:heme exporter protein A
MQIVAEGLGCVRGDRLVFRGLSFELSAGKALVLAGPNGSGKTTLLRVLAGLLAATFGRLQYLGDDRAVISDDTRDQSIHFVAHNDTIKSAMSVNETLLFHADILNADRARVAEAMNVWDIERLRDLPGALLSAGQRRRVALARLSLQPRCVWLLDEPLVALDRSTRVRLHDVCAEHRAHGGLIVAASHEPFLEDATVLELGARA